MTIRLHLSCDAPNASCENRYFGPPDTTEGTELRENASAFGWYHDPLSRNDYCPIHDRRRYVTLPQNVKVR
jgi:hypothetical protein